MNSQPGTYILILRSDITASIEIGRWGQLQLCPGYYAYIGSAFGSGGVRARVSRHCGSAKKMHWHIDYLRQHTHPVSVWYSHSRLRLEHDWARLMSGFADVRPVAGFGCSDCVCESHLFFSARMPEPRRFGEMAGVAAKVWSCDALG